MSERRPTDELKPSEVADLLGVDPTTVRGWIREGILPARRTRPSRSTATGRVGVGHWRVKRADVEALQQQSARDARVIKRTQEDRQTTD
jgi:excisionase family DNA binding protein